MNGLEQQHNAHVIAHAPENVLLRIYNCASLAPDKILLPAYKRCAMIFTIV